MSNRLSIAFVAAQDGLLRRLPEILAGADTEIRVVAPPGSVLAQSSFVTSVSTVGKRGDAEDFMSALLSDDELLRSLPTWTLWGSDQELRVAARSDLDLDLKLQILPVRREAGLHLLGSKVGLALVTDRLDVPRPRSVVVSDASELASGLAALDRPALVKGDQGGSGTQILDASRLSSEPSEAIPSDWYPLLIQEFIDGVEVSVEALFGEGRLLAWQYSHPTTLERRFGRSMAREFFDPPNVDFVSSLQALAAECGLHGFANCSFIREADSRHRIIEVDMRATAWHQFGPHLGVDWRSVMSDRADWRDPLHPRIGAGRRRRLHLYPRELVHAFAAMSWVSAAPWLRREEGTWNARNRADRAINRIERRHVLYEASRLPAVAWRRVRSE